LGFALSLCCIGDFNFWPGTLFPMLAQASNGGAGVALLSSRPPDTGIAVAANDV
jgi:hypothetical protein